MDWPIMVDAQNELGVQVVPITLFIDEHGIVRENRPLRRHHRLLALLANWGPCL